MRHRRAARLGWATGPMVLLGLAVHAAGVAGLSLAGPLPALSLPGWTPLGVPALAYVVGAVAAVRRFAIAPLAATLVTAGALHAVLIVLPVAVAPWIASYAGGRTVAPPAVTSPALAVLTMLSVTLSLVPFRRLVTPRPRYGRVAPRAGYPAAGRPVRTEAEPRSAQVRRVVSAAASTPPAPPAPLPAAARAAAVKPPAATMGPFGRAPATSAMPPAVLRPAAPAAPPMPAIAPPEHVPAPPRGGTSAPPAAAPPSAPPVTASPPPTPTRRSEPPAAPAAAAGRRPGAEPIEDTIRIAFARIADQVPANLFRLPADRLGANLVEAGFLLIPRRLVLPQLAEGFVQVPWHVVADQFPKQALTVAPSEVAERIANGLIVLPLDEVVRQMPAELFALTTPEVDVRGIEDFPPPFQPHVPPPSVSHDEADGEVVPSESTAPDAAATSELPPTPSEPVLAVADPAEVEPGETAPEEEIAAESVTIELVAEPELVPEPMAPLSSSPPDAPEEELDEVVLTVEPVWREPSRPDDSSDDSSSAPPLVDDVSPAAPASPAPAPVLAHDGAMAPADAGERASDAEQMPSVILQLPINDGARVHVRRIAALLSPLMTPLETGTVAHRGHTVLTVLPPAMDETAAVETVLPVLPFLTDARLLSPPVQATLRTLAGALVLTPLAPGDPDGPVLLTATPAGASLALLERLSLRAAHGWQAEHGTVRSARPGRPPSPDAGLRSAEVPPHVQAMAASLQAFGAVFPSVLRGTDEGLLVYLFLPRGVDPVPLGAVARDLTRALLPGRFGSLESITLRAESNGRLVVRTLAIAPATVLVAGGGPVNRPGLAWIELDRAVAQLGAVGA